MSASIFDGVSARDVDRITATARRVTLPAGWSPIGESTPGDKAYIITSGEVSVRRGGEEIARLGPGDIVGEAAIVSHKLRSASVVALTPLEALHFTAEDLERLAEEIPAFGQRLRDSTTSRAKDAG